MIMFNSMCSVAAVRFIGQLFLYDYIVIEGRVAYGTVKEDGYAN